VARQLGRPAGCWLLALVVVAAGCTEMRGGGAQVQQVGGASAGARSPARAQAAGRATRRGGDVHRGGRAAGEQARSEDWGRDGAEHRRGAE
jgi:hypothetical protein